MNSSLDLTVDKLIVLYVADMVSVPLTNETITEICSNNNWVSFMICKQCIADLIDARFLVNVSKGTSPIYSISSDGRECLSCLYHKIPLSTRDAIKAHIQDNISTYKRKQEYIANYNKNADSSYTVVLKIVSLETQPVMELRLNVKNANTAKWIHKQWIEKAPEVYESIYELLLV